MVVNKKQNKVTISMGKMKHTVINSCFGISLSIIIAGCAGQTNHLKVDAAANTTLDSTSAQTQPVITSSQRRVLDKRLNTIPPEEDIALGDDENAPDDNLDNAVEDPSVEDEGEVGTAVLSAAQQLLNKNARGEQNDDIWPRIRAGFSLPDRDHPNVQPSREWFANHQTYLDRTFTRAAPYMHYIAEEVEARQMPLEIALLPVVESAFQPFAYSRSHAAGIWQFIPGTATHYGLKINWWYDGRRDIHASTNAALTYLQKLHDQFNNDWLLALAAYNSGEGTVGRAIIANQNRGLGTTFWDLDLPSETRNYVPRLLAIATVVANPEAFGLTLREIPNKPLLKQVSIGSQLDLAIAAEMADIDLEELYTFNPGFNRWATAPNGPHTLLLPLEKADAFEVKLAALTPSQRMAWAQYQIRSGDNLGQIAKQYGVSIAAIQRANKLDGNIIQTGQTLIIPTSSRASQEYLLSANQRLESRQNSAKAKQKIIYTVRSGDTLSHISARQKVSLSTLASWNKMKPKDTLRKGQKLVIWKDGTQGATRLSQNSSTTKKVKYRVRSGDSLARISQKFNVTINNLKEWNPKVRGQVIQPGQQLVVYVDRNRSTDNS